MKKNGRFCCRVIFLALGIVITAHAQDKQQVTNLATLGKVWGFLKYYHPDAAKGNPDWDKELVRMIPLIKSVSSKKACEQLLADWFHSLPKARLAAMITQERNDSTKRIFDEADIRDFGLSRPLTAELLSLYRYHLPDSSKYITNRSGKYTLDYIKHLEEPFDKPEYPGEPHRLLALFRYWNIIQYFYAYKLTHTTRWDRVLITFIPRFMAARNENEYQGFFHELTARLRDSHSFYYQQNWNNRHFAMNLPFELVYIRGSYFISGSRYDSLMRVMDFKIGDEIVGVNGKSTKERIRELAPYITGTNELSFYRNIGNFLFKTDTLRKIQLTIRRKGMLIDKNTNLFTELEIARFAKSKRPAWEDLGNGIWYVRICDITKTDTLKQLFRSIRDARTVIWDMRAYPNFNVVRMAGKALFGEDIQSEINYNFILGFPGALRKSVVGNEYAGIEQLPVYRGRMIVLVNEKTQSLSESVAAELRLRPNTIIMGSQTAGTTGNIVWTQYPGGVEVAYTAVGVEGVQKSFIAGKGVKIDKPIDLTYKRLISYKDYMLEMAYQEALR